LQYENLAVPVVTHAMYDFVALVYLVRNDERPATADTLHPNDETDSSHE
jgi:hypothetical protein